ncbi:MAG: fatty acid desaturase [Planctomycetota bacterium]
MLRLYLALPVNHALLSLYIACEHRGLPTTGSVLERTRSFAAGPLTRWLFWNMPYHAEHHAYPAVPFHALPRLHAALVHRTRGPLWLHMTGGRG